MNLPGTEAIMEFTAAETSAGCQVALKTPPTAMWNLSRAFEQSVWSPILFFYRTLKKNIPSVQHSGVCRAHPGSWVSPFSERHSLSLGLMVLPLWSMECAQGFVVVVLVALPCLTLCNPMDYSLPGSSVYEILQARILEWIAIPFSRGSSQPRDRNQVSCIAGSFYTVWAIWGHLKLPLLWWLRW